MISISSFCLVVLLLTPPILSQITDAPQTIDLSPPYLSLRSCAQLCFWQPYPGNFRSDAIASYLSCTQPSIYSGAFESCWCRQDYQPDVVNYISSCVSSKCQDSPGDYRIDVSKATGVYQGYCASVVSRGGGGGGGGMVTPVTTGARETGAVSVFTEVRSTIDGAKSSLVESVPVNTSPPSTIIPATTTAGSTDTGPTSTNSSTASTSTQGGGLSTGTIAGIAVGAVVGSILILLVVICVKSNRVRKLLGLRQPAQEMSHGHMSVGIYTADGLPVKNGVVYGDGRAETEYSPGTREGV
ncbi:hypothetical protein EYR41_007975 [Orbilia oligospora]|uniref:Uncharacterized protein n=1 Tax=Orbilia oligospora TaxID=2813651 RepID=A0A7C8TR25_ORBOL|nr:hypothetical protein TWF751_002711 [Orbilia oligospora]KAF3294676.1 hypothetical protein TWF132_003154 [Orbilia oligospora]TGJ66331.1 hypothetical protein EYR41_007975 [Orbilia oligospora]